MMISATDTIATRHRRVTETLDRQSERMVRELAHDAGVEIDGSRPHDIQVHDPRFYTRLLAGGPLGFGESYMDGQWDCDALDVMIDKVFRANLHQKVRRNWSQVVHLLKARVMNMQSPMRAFQVGEQHYDLGNDLYEAMLDSRMVYTCAYWRNAGDLDQAQEAKLELVCRKLGLAPGMKVLELGCGWGSFAKFAAERYGVSVVGFTVSKEQVELGNKRCKGLPVELHLDDYRNATGIYDAVVSIGLLEHVGHRNYRTYMELARRCLKDDGVALVHVIGSNHVVRALNPWFHKYIFPNSALAALSQLATAAERLFVIEDVHNIGPDYDRTLMAWYERFEAAWPRLRDKYGARFYRMWRFYLLTSAGTFRARDHQLFQLVLTPTGRAQPPGCRAI